ncbi:unnamed protein product [Leuciscus chuanchicus]
MASVDSVKIASLRRNCMEYERNEQRSIGRLPCQHHHFKRTRFGRLSANSPSNILAIREFISPPAFLRSTVLQRSLATDSTSGKNTISLSGDSADLWFLLLTASFLKGVATLAGRSRCWSPG